MTSEISGFQTHIRNHFKWILHSEFRIVFNVWDEIVYSVSKFLCATVLKWTYAWQQNYIKFVSDMVFDGSWHDQDWLFIWYMQFAA